jgi:hypothetical protein
MADVTITYKSKEAGQQVSCATYLNSVDDDAAQTILGIITPYQLPNSWNAINSRDAVINGDGSPVVNCKEARMTWLMSDLSTSFLHVPFLRSSVTVHDIKQVFSPDGDEAASLYCDANGHTYHELVACDWVNIR